MKLRFPLRAYKTLDRLYLHYDKKMIRRTRNLALMPGLSQRLAPGRPSYGEWCYLVGVFQTLLRTNLKNQTDNDILDVGCGTGIMAIATEPFLGDKGHYTGIDVKRSDIEISAGNITRTKTSHSYSSTHAIKGSRPIKTQAK